MPSKSKKQHNFMEMIAHDPEAAKRTGVPQKVGREFVDADKAKGRKALKKLPEKKAKPK